MKEEDFTYLSNLIQKRSGLVLTPEKSYLLESRLSNVLRKHNIGSMEMLVAQLQIKWEEKLIQDIVDAMTTNESLFFRDMKPFDACRERILPALIQARSSGKKIRIWSAACSKGQEPFSLAMLIKEMGAATQGVQFEILATDLSHDILEKAEDGIFTQFEVQRGLPITMLVKYFTQLDENRWQVKPEIKKMIQFKSFNLLDSFDSLGQFDLVFCRNVLIYFDPPTKAKIFDKMGKIIAPDGYLILGGSETVVGISDRFKVKPEERGILQHADALKAAQAG